MKTNIDDYVYGGIVYEAIKAESEVISDECNGCAFNGRDQLQECADAPRCDLDNSDNIVNFIWVEKK